MIEDETSPINPSLANEIEDAVMFGKARDLELLLENTSEDALPADVRQGLESLQYFRAHYGSAKLEEVDRKKVTLMDSAWAMELLNRVRSRVENILKKQA